MGETEGEIEGTYIEGALDELGTLLGALRELGAFNGHEILFFLLVGQPNHELGRPRRRRRLAPSYSSSVSAIFKTSFVVVVTAAAVIIVSVVVIFSSIGFGRRRKRLHYSIDLTSHSSF